MTPENAKLSVIAYYLSKFDMEAVKALKYPNRSDAISAISSKIGSGNSYLKLRRDEFDVLTGSHRRGYANRKPTKDVLNFHNQLKNISFEDFTAIISQLIVQSSPALANCAQDSFVEIASDFSDVEIEAIINAKDTSATILHRKTDHKIRYYNPAIIENLKKLYSYRCQICGYSAQEYGAHIVEAHHILPFCETQNNDSDNILILCPNHHRLIHQAHPVFERQQKTFIFNNEKQLHIEINLHL